MVLAADGGIPVSTNCQVRILLVHNCVDSRARGPHDLGGDVEAQEDVLGLPPLGGVDDYSLKSSLNIYHDHTFTLI